MKISMLTENTPFKPEFAYEHGLSIYIETANHKILFDTGQSGMFANNARTLGIDLSAVDIAILSHGHYDHGGGIIRFLAINDCAPVYVNRNAFGQYYNASGKYIGLDPALADNERLILTDDNCRIDDELALCTCNHLDRKYPTDSAGLTEKTNSGLIADRFLHEQYLIIRDGNRHIVISGCSHKGILNITEWLKTDVLIGGFHLMKIPMTGEVNPTLDRTAEALCGYNTEYYTCHCTGKEQYSYLKNRMGAKLYYLASGQALEIK